MVISSVFRDPLPFVGLAKFCAGKRITAFQSERDAPHLAGLAIGQHLHLHLAQPGNECGEVPAISKGRIDLFLQHAPIRHLAGAAVAADFAIGEALFLAALFAAGKLQVVRLFQLLADPD